jgi:hypothetical protein
MLAGRNPAPLHMAADQDGDREGRKTLEMEVHFQKSQSHNTHWTWAGNLNPTAPRWLFKLMLRGR